MSMKEIALAIDKTLSMLAAAYTFGFHEFRIARGTEIYRFILKTSEGILSLEEGYNRISLDKEHYYEIMKNWDIIYKGSKEAFDFLQDRMKEYEDAKELLSPFVLNENLTK